MHLRHFLALSGLLSLLLLPTLTKGSFFGSCNPSGTVCGFMCCTDSETCVSDFCVSHEYISSILLDPSVTRAYPTLTAPAVRSSLLSQIANGEASEISSIYREFKSIMTDAPMPTQLNGAGGVSTQSEDEGSEEEGTTTSKKSVKETATVKSEETEEASTKASATKETPTETPDDTDAEEAPNDTAAAETGAAGRVAIKGAMMAFVVAGVVGGL